MEVTLEKDLDLLEGAMNNLFRTIKRPQNWTIISHRANTDIDRPSGAILHILARRPDKQMTLKRLAGSLGIEAPSVTRKVQELERGGFITRAIDPLDKRITNIRLTDSGSRVSEKLWQARRSLMYDVLHNWTETDRQRFIELFSLFSDGVAAEYMKLATALPMKKERI